LLGAEASQALTSRLTADKAGQQQLTLSTFFEVNQSTAPPPVDEDSPPLQPGRAVSV